MNDNYLIVGKWYRITNGLSSGIGDNIWYGKFLEIRNTIVTCSEFISNNTLKQHEGNFGSIKSYNFTEIKLSEIESILPNEHPDKLINQIDNLNYVEPLINLLKQIE